MVYVCVCVGGGGCMFLQYYEPVASVTNDDITYIKSYLLNLYVILC